MSTRAAIIAKVGDKYRGIYCHFDGYLSSVGKKLLDNYSNPEKVAALISLGDISSLGKEVVPKGTHTYENREEGVTVAYMRDRGESGCEAREGDTAAEVASKIDHNGYVYVFDGVEWACNDTPLAMAIKAEASE